MFIQSMNLIVTESSIVILFLVFRVKAQDDSSKTVIRPLHPSLAVIIGILSVMFSLTFLLLAYAKFCQDTSRADGSDEEQTAQDVLRSVSQFSGIERTVVESLPFFRFSSLKGSKKGLECAICISKFEETEILRMLPRCRHAFHIVCIDKWLESHSSCPLCRYKFNADDLTSFRFTNSLRYPHNSSNLSEEPNLELLVQREQDHYKPSRFNMISNLQRLAMSRKEEQLLQKCKNGLHKFKHQIIISDLVCRSRWSDLNSSDLMFLNSEMLNFMSSKRFTPENTINLRFGDEFRMNEDILKIKEDIERKRMYESKVSRISINQVSSSSSLNASNHDLNASTTSRTLDPAEKRSMSEIVHLSRYADFSLRDHVNESLDRSSRKDERVKSLWLPIARRTVQWFSGREGDLMYKAPQSNV